MTSNEAQPSKRRWIFVGIAALFATAGLVTAALLGVFSPGDPEPVAAPVETAPPTVEPAPEPEPEPEPLPDPSIEIAETREMEFTPVWNPPDHGEYFWQIVDPEHGYPKTGGTTYLLAHACESQTCAGDSLRTLEAGATLTYKGETYRVESKTSTMKNEIAELPIWEHVPGRLVLVTCIIETSWETSDKNEVLVASRV